MTDAEATANAMSDPDNPPITDEDFVRMPRVYTPAQIHAIRAHQNLSQAAFARRFGLPQRQLQDWEQGRKVPSASVNTLLTVIAREPEAVARALALKSA